VTEACLSWTTRQECLGSIFFGDSSIQIFMLLGHSARLANPVASHAETLIRQFWRGRSRRTLSCRFVFGKCYRLRTAVWRDLRSLISRRYVSTDQITLTAPSPGSSFHYTTNGAIPIESDPNRSFKQHRSGNFWHDSVPRAFRSICSRAQSRVPPLLWSPEPLSLNHGPVTTVSS